MASVRRMSSVRPSSPRSECPCRSGSYTIALNEAMATQASIVPHGRAGFLQKDHVLAEHPIDQRDENFAVGDATVDGLALGDRRDLVVGAGCLAALTEQRCMAAGSMKTSIDCRGPARTRQREIPTSSMEALQPERLPSTTYRSSTSCARQLPTHNSSQFSPALHDFLYRLHAPVLGTAFSCAGAREIFVELDNGALALSVRGPRLTGRDEHDDERFFSNGVGAGELDGKAPAILKAQCKAAELAQRITKTPRCFNAINRPRVKIMQRRFDQAESSSHM